jgi:hypothetical protein
MPFGVTALKSIIDLLRMMPSTYIPNLVLIGALVLELWEVGQ